MFSYFTISEANKVLPSVIEKFKTVVNYKNQIMKMEQELNATLMPNTTFEQYVKVKHKLNSTVTKFYQAIEELENTCVVIK